MLKMANNRLFKQQMKCIILRYKVTMGDVGYVTTRFGFFDKHLDNHKTYTDYNEIFAPVLFSPNSPSF